MKKQIITLLFCLACVSSVSIAQNLRDVVHLKNGSIIKGRIIEQTPNVQLRIQTADGSIFVYSFDEVTKITTEAAVQNYTINPAEPAKPVKDPPDMREYKYQLGIGLALGGGGVAGIPIRLGMGRKVAFEIGVYARPLFIQTKTTRYDYYGHSIGEDTENDFSVPAMIAGGMDVFFGEKYSAYGDKIIRNGITVKLGKTMTDKVGESMFAIGWARERFKGKRKKSSYIMNLGAGVIKYDRDMVWMGTDIETDITPMIFWKFHWNWGLF